jgi:hypothetical protein
MQMHGQECAERERGGAPSPMHACARTPVPMRVHDHAGGEPLLLEKKIKKKKKKSTGAAEDPEGGEGQGGADSSGAIPFACAWRGCMWGMSCSGDCMPQTCVGAGPLAACAHTHTRMHGTHTRPPHTPTQSPPTKPRPRL